MRPPVWRPPVEPSPAEQRVIGLVRRAKLFVWLRQHRHELLDDGFQTELAAAYQHSPKGQPPVPPAQLALATILQAYTGAGDDEVVEATVMDRRWPRPRVGSAIGRCGRRLMPARCGGLVGWRTPSTCWVTPCARRWASSRGSRGGGCRGTRGSRRWPTRPAWGCLAPPA